MTGIEMIAEKVRTNVEHKSYTMAHDDAHNEGELIIAAECYLARAGLQVHFGDVSIGTDYALGPAAWPFEREAWKPSDDPIRNLVHAGALIVAEIERLRRIKRPKQHLTSCAAYSNYQPPYHECTCGAEK